jgi:3-mercaptopyruvate sulfurtransferase SseA
VLDMNAHNIKNAAALLGGWNGWQQAKLPVESAAVKKK